MYINMFIKRKTRAGKAYAYQMLESFKMLVAYIFFQFHARQLCLF